MTECQPFRPGILIALLILLATLITSTIKAEDDVYRDPPHWVPVEKQEGLEFVGGYGGAFTREYALGNHVLAVGNRLVRVLDATQPNSPRELVRLRMQDRIDGVALKGTTAYLSTDSPGGIVVVDLSDPSRPRVTGSLNEDGDPNSLYVIGDLLLSEVNWKYLTGGNIYSLQDPLKPALRFYGKFYDTKTFGRLSSWFITDGQSIYGTKLIGREAFVENGEELYRTKLALMNFSSDVPTTVTLCTIPSDPDVPIPDLFTADESGMLFLHPNTGERIRLRGIQSGPYLWYDYEGIVHRYPSPQTQPAATEAIPPIREYGKNLSEAVFTGTTVILREGDHGVMFLDCTDPAHPRPFGVIELPEPFHAMAADAGNFYGGTADGTVYAYDASSLALHDIFELKAPLRSMSASANRLYVAAGQAGLVVVDTNQPNQLHAVGSHKTAHICNDVITSGTLAYLAAGDLEIVDVADPAHPVLRSSMELQDHQLKTLEKCGEALYLINQSSEELEENSEYVETPVDIIDVSDPSAPRHVEKFCASAQDSGEDLQISEDSEGNLMKGRDDDTWCLGLPIATTHNYKEDTSAMRFYDLSDPFNPKWLDDIDGIRKLQPAIMSKGLVFLADDGEDANGFMIFRPQLIR